MPIHPILSSIESLESRIAPANVAAVLTNGILRISPINVTQGVDASLVQTGPAAFDVFDDGQLVDSFSNVLALRLTGGAAADTLAVDLLDDIGTRFAGPLRVTAGGGTGDAITIAAGHLGGDLRIVAGRETQIVTDGGSIIAGSLSVNSTGRGSEGTFAGTFGTAHIFGLHRTTLGDFHAFGVTEVALRGTVGSELHTGAQTRIDGPSYFESYPSNGSVVSCTGSVFGGPVDIVFSGGANQVSLEDVVIDRRLRVHLGSSGSTLRLDGASIRGDASFLLGDGVTSAEIVDGSTIGGDLFFSSSFFASNSTVTIADSTVYGFMDASLRAGAGSVLVQDSDLLFGAGVTGGPGETEFIVDAASTIRGIVYFKGGSGANTLDIAEVGQLISVQYIGGGGQDSLILKGTGGEFLRVIGSLGGNNDTASLLSAHLLGLFLDGGSGFDAATVPIINPLIGPQYFFTGIEEFNPV